MARRQHKNSISLFPFLAVLVCTMGALILLLLVTTRKIRHDQLQGQVSEQLSPDSPETAVPPASNTVSGLIVPAGDRPDESLELAEVNRDIASLLQQIQADRQRLSELQATTDSRQKTTAALHKELSGLNQEIRELESATEKSSLLTLQQQSAELTAARETQQNELDDQALKLLKKQQQLYTLKKTAQETAQELHERRSALVSLRRQVDLQRQSGSSATGTRTLLEFSNSTGTTRTPIVIDVSNAGYEFLPTGVRITAADMEGFPVKDNPLLSAILTLHRQRSEDSVVSEPYVLLLVRPDGCLPFYGAQRVLTEAKVHYGYELLSPDRKLDVGTQKAIETELVRNAILESLNRRETLYAVLEDEISSRIRGSDRSPGESSRRLIVRPDGRVIATDGDSTAPLEGRFYAGGEALPRDFVRSVPRRPLGPERRPSPTGISGFENSNSGMGNNFNSESSANKPRVESPAGGSGYAENSTSADGTTPLDGTRSVVGTESVAVSSVPASGSNVPDWQPQSLIRQDQSTASHPQNAAQSLNSDESLLAQWMESGDGNTSAEASLLGNPAVSSSASDTGQAGSGSPGPGREGNLKHIDGELLELLKSQKPFSRDAATPVGVTVFLDAGHMTIGQQPTIPLTPDTLQNGFAKLLLAISEEVAAARTKPTEPLMPVVKFVVSPGGEQLRIPLAKELRKMGIASASVVEITPYIVPDDNSTKVDSTKTVAVDDHVGRSRVENSETSRTAVNRETPNRTGRVRSGRIQSKRIQR